jgi:hypothetical protein
LADDCLLDDELDEAKRSDSTIDAAEFLVRGWRTRG